jgi:serine/threonine protein kinase
MKTKGRKINRLVKRRRKLTRRFTKSGGAIIGKGSFGIVTNPPSCIVGTYEDEEVGKVMLKSEAEKENKRLMEILKRFPEELTSVYSLYIQPKGECAPDPTNADIIKYMGNITATASGSPVPPISEFTVLRYKNAGNNLDKLGFLLSGYNELKAGGPAALKAPEIYNGMLKGFLDSLHKVFFSLRLLNMKGIVHRDIKPGNITAHPTDGLVIIDFGLATLMDNPKDGLMGDTSGYVYPYWPLEGPIVMDIDGFLHCADSRLQSLVNAVYRGKIFKKPDSEALPNTRVQYHFSLLDGDLVKSPDYLANQIYMLVEEIKKICNLIVTANTEGFSRLVEYLLPEVNPPHNFNIYFNISAVNYFVSSMENPVNHTPENIEKMKQIELLKDTLRQYLYMFFDVYSLGITILYILHTFKLGLHYTKVVIEPKNIAFAEDVIALAKRMASTRITSRPTMEEAMKVYEELERKYA